MSKSKRFYQYDTLGGKLWAYRRVYKSRLLRRKGFSTKADADAHLRTAMMILTLLSVARFASNLP